MNAPCSDCSRSAQNPAWGGYRMTCLSCCARLVLSAHPDKQQAAALLGSIELRSGRPERKEILSAVKERLTGKPSSSTPRGTLS